MAAPALETAVAAGAAAVAAGAEATAAAAAAEAAAAAAATRASREWTDAPVKRWRMRHDREPWHNSRL